MTNTKGATMTSSGRGGGGARTPRLTQLGRYRIERSIGIGGSACVYLAIDTSIEKRVALKVLHEHLRDDSVTVRRFANDARSLARLNHPNIVQVFSAELDQFYFAMEYVEGVDLGCIIATSGSLPANRALAMATQMADALAHIHGCGLIHRDVKPGNVLVAPGDRIKMTDFSVVQSAEETVLTLKGSLIGTVEYMPPEQIREEEIDVRADIYSLGTVLFEMLTGRPPFVRGAEAADLWPLMERILTAEAPSLREIDPEIPSAIAALVSAMLAKKREARPESMAAVAAEFRRLLGETTTIHVVPVVLAEPVESEGRTRLSWTESSAEDFSRYEVHASSERDFSVSESSLIASLSARQETELMIPSPKKGGMRYYRIRSIQADRLGALSNRVGFEHGRRAPFWRRPAFLALLFAALISSLGATMIHQQRTTGERQHVAVDLVRAKGSISRGKGIQTGGFQLTMSDLKLEFLERGEFANQFEEQMPTSATLELSPEMTRLLEAEGMDPAFLPRQEIEVTGVIVFSSTERLLVIRPRRIEDLVIERPSPQPQEIAAATWKDYRNRVVRLTSTVRDIDIAPRVNRVVLREFDDREAVVVFPPIAAAFETLFGPLDELKGKTVTVTGRVSYHDTYKWQIILERPEHLVVRP